MRKAIISLVSLLTPPALYAADAADLQQSAPERYTVVEGDTIQLTLINPEDDDHSFVLPDLAVPLPPNKTTKATDVAKHPGIFPIVCAVQSHLPMMSGQLVVLAASSMAGVSSSDANPGGAK